MSPETRVPQLKKEVGVLPHPAILRDSESEAMPMPGPAGKASLSEELWITNCPTVKELTPGANHSPPADSCPWPQTSSAHSPGRSSPRLQLRDRTRAPTAKSSSALRGLVSAPVSHATAPVHGPIKSASRQTSGSKTLREAVPPSWKRARSSYHTLQNRSSLEHRFLHVHL